MRFVLRAEGYKGELPTQAQCQSLDWLPEMVWSDLWRSLSITRGKRIGEERFKDAVCAYAAMHGIALKDCDALRNHVRKRSGHLPQLSETTAPATEAAATVPDPTASAPVPDSAVPKAPRKGRVEADSEILKVLPEALKEYLPASTHAALEKGKPALPRKFLTALRKAIREERCPARREKRNRLMTVLETAHPQLAQEFANLCLAVGLEAVEAKIKVRK